MAGENVVFFGKALAVECQRCGAFAQTSNGHAFCAQVACPIALREYKRRRQRRGSKLEQAFLPNLHGTGSSAEA